MMNNNTRKLRLEWDKTDHCFYFLPPLDDFDDSLIYVELTINEWEDYLNSRNAWWQWQDKLEKIHNSNK